MNQYWNNPTFNGVTELTVGGLAAINLVTVTAGVGAPMGIIGGTAIVATSAMSRSSAPNRDSCPDAVRIAAAIVPCSRRTDHPPARPRVILVWGF